MEALSPSTLMAMPNIKPSNAIANVDDAYTMAERVGNYQDKQKVRNDEAIMQQALQSGYGMSTPDQVDQLTEYLKGRVSPQTYTNLGKYKTELTQSMATIAENMMKLDEAKWQEPIKKAEMWARSTRPIVEDYFKKKEEVSKLPAEQQPEAMQRLQAEYSSGIQAVAGQFSGTSPSGKPFMDPKKVEEMVKKTPEQTRSALEASDYWTDYLTKKYKAELEKSHAKYYEEGRGGKAEIAREMYENGEITREEMLKMLSPGGGVGAAQNARLLDDKGIKFKADQLVAGDDTKALRGMTRGDIAAVNEELSRRAETGSITPQKLQAARANLTSSVAGLNVAKKRQATTEISSYEIDKFADPLRDILGNVMRTNSQAANWVMREVATQFGSEDRAAIKVLTTELKSAYAAALSRTGASNQDVRKMADEAFKEDQTLGQWMKTLDTVQKISVPAILGSSKAVSSDLLHSIDPSRPAEHSTTKASAKGNTLTNEQILKAVKDGTLSADAARKELTRRKSSRTPPKFDSEEQLQAAIKAKTIEPGMTFMDASGKIWVLK